MQKSDYSSKQKINQKKSYTKPSVKVLGDVLSMTQTNGGSIVDAVMGMGPAPMG
jgi:hypothetical protein